MSELQAQMNEILSEVDKTVANGTVVVEDVPKKEAGTTESAVLDDMPSTEVPMDVLSKADPKTLTDAELVRYLQIKEYERQKQRYDRYMNKGKLVPKEHKFWNTQPVLSLTEEANEVNCPIDATNDLSKVKQEPYNMPAGFEWCSIDIKDPAQVQEIYNLLNANYVEDDEAMFRFDYSVSFLQWALSPPGYLQDWHVGVRNTKTKALMGCITAIPVEMQVYDATAPMAEINFLCVHKKLRTKRLAPVLIKEITRRVNLTNRWQAVYTAGVVLPKPVAKCRYFHRSLNPKKLIEIRFSSLPPKTTLASHIQNLKLPKRPVHTNLRLMTKEDVPAVHALLTDYLSKKTKLSQIFTLEDVAHIFVPRKEVVSTYVLDSVATDNSGSSSSSNNKITDMCSFYYLPSTVIGNPIHDKLNAVYSYYNIANTMSFEVLMKDLLVLAKNEGADVFNALDVIENAPVFENLLFGAGDGYLQYYLYNWKCPTMEAGDIGLVLL